MNKQIKKLRLSKETLRTLSGRDLLGAAGGATSLCSRYCEPTEGYVCSFETCPCSASGCPSNQTDCC